MSATIRPRGRSSMAEPQPSKLVMRVRFSSPAPPPEGQVRGMIPSPGPPHLWRIRQQVVPAKCPSRVRCLLFPFVLVLRRLPLLLDLGVEHVGDRPACRGAGPAARRHCDTLTPSPENVIETCVFQNCTHPGSSGVRPFGQDSQPLFQRAAVEGPSRIGDQPRQVDRGRRHCLHMVHVVTAVSGAHPDRVDGPAQIRRSSNLQERCLDQPGSRFLSGCRIGSPSQAGTERDRSISDHAFIVPPLASKRPANRPAR